MRRLYILRHEKADYPPGAEDKARPLSPEGERDAKALGAAMRAHGYMPDTVLCSAAQRTRETCAAVYDGGNIVYDEGLYLAGAGHLYETLKAADDQYASLLLVGHNPGLQALVQMLAGTGDPKLLGQVQAGYHTGCLSVFDCGCEKWRSLMLGENRLVDLLVGEQLS